MFLEAHIPEEDIGRCRIIEWRPSINIFREKYVNLLSQAVHFIKRTDAGNRTTAAFGRKWVKNFFKNLKNINNCLLFRQCALPVIIAASGPSLEKSLPVIKNAQDNCLIIAASSSMMALDAGGITADIVISTDGGNWALRHIYPGLRQKKISALAVNLNAALPSQCLDIAHLIINDGSFWQSIVLHELALPSVIISQKGTVSATALELALQLSAGNIFLAGMDFSLMDIRTHARPYGFDSLFFNSSYRLRPFYSESFVRSRRLREGGSMEIYASWFKSRQAQWPKRIFSISGENKIFENGDSLLRDNLSEYRHNKKNIEDCLKAVRTKEDSALFCNRGISALLSALENPQYSENIKQELKLLLFPKVLPEERDVTDYDLEKAIKEIV